MAIGSVTTDGLVVRGTAFDTSQRKPGKAATAVQQSSPLKGIPLLGGKKAIAPAMAEHLAKHRTTLRVVGIDPGMVIPCAATTIPPDPDSCEARNILVSKASLTEHTTRFTRRLDAKKSQPTTIAEQPGVIHPSMKEVDERIPGRGIPGFQAVQQYTQWLVAHEPLIKIFYCSTWYKRQQWQHAKQGRAEFDRVFDAIVHSASTDLTTRKGHRDVLTMDTVSGFCSNLVIVIGNGDFGPTSRHRTLMKHLIKKVSCTTADFYPLYCA